jgi:hypothetical protein
MNNTAKYVMTLGWSILLLGIIIGIGWATSYENVKAGLICAISSLITGTLFIGIGEIIHLLQALVNKDNVQNKIEIQDNDNVIA